MKGDMSFSRDGQAERQHDHLRELLAQNRVVGMEVTVGIAHYDRAG